MSNHRVPIYILAGGRSSRFGSDKARAVLDGEHLISRVHRLLEPFASSLTVIAEYSDKYADLGLSTIGDISPGLGPLAGLQTALNHSAEDEDWLLLCSCDAFVIHQHWIKQLLAARRDTLHAVAFQVECWQPMPAVYSRSCLPIVDDQIGKNDLSMQHLLDRLAVQSLPIPQDWPRSWQINTKADLAGVTSHARPAPRGTNKSSFER